MDWGEPPLKASQATPSTAAPTGGPDWGEAPVKAASSVATVQPTGGRDWGEAPVSSLGPTSGTPGSAQEFREATAKLTGPLIHGAAQAMQESGVPLDALKQAAQTLSPMYSWLDYPANWAMRQVGSRIGAFATTVGKNLLEGNLPGPISVGASILTGKPQTDARTGGLGTEDITGLDPDVPTYSMLRQKGLPPGQAAAGAMLLEGVAAGPLNELGAGALKGAGSLAGLARATPAVQALAEKTAPLMRNISRTFELTPAEKDVIDTAVFNGRGIENMTNEEFNGLGKSYLDAAKSGSKARQEPVESALTRMGTAQENLARMPQEEALAGLTDKERAAIQGSQAALSKIPGLKSTLDMAPDELNAQLPYLVKTATQQIQEAKAARLAFNESQDVGDGVIAAQKEAAAQKTLGLLEDTGRQSAKGLGGANVATADRLLGSLGAKDVGYIPRIMDEETAQAMAQKEGLSPDSPQFQSRVNALRTGGAPNRSIPPDVTTAESGVGFRPQNEALPIYGSRTGQQMRNGSIVSTVMRNLSKPAEEAPAGWRDPSSLGLMGGMNDAFKAQYENARVSPTVYRYLQDWEKVNLPASVAGIQNLHAKLLSLWKPLVTTIRPEFLERFAGWHMAKSVIDGNLDPENYIDGILAASGKQAHMPVQDIPGISTVGDLREAAIKAGAIGGHGQQDFNTLIGARLNSGIYDATKTSYLAFRLRQGDTLEQAAKATREALFDYSPANFTAFENFMRRNVAPFYAFRRQIIPAFARTAVGRSGSLGFAHQVIADINASKGYTNQQAGALLPGGEESGVLVGNPDIPTARKLSGSPFRDVNQTLGQQGKGIPGYWDGMMALMAPTISTPVHELTGRGAFGQDLRKNTKLPDVARLMPQPMRDKLGVYEENGELKGPGRLAELLYAFPPPVNAAVQMARGKAPLKFLGAAPADTANVSASLARISANQRAALQELRMQRQR